MFSALKRLTIPGQRLPFVQYIVSLAVVQAVQEQARERLQVRGGERLPAASSLGMPLDLSSPARLLIYLQLRLLHAGQRRGQQQLQHRRHD